MTSRRTAVLSLVLFAGFAAPAGAVLAPLDGQVNNDNSASVGIDPARAAGVSDVTGGALTAGNLEIPWATFEQQTAGAQNVFVRAFKNGAWVTEGFPASLNVDPTKEAEEPAIDFAGPGRTVPWVAWYEPNDAFGSPTEVFASRFLSDPAAQGGGRWQLEGQDRHAPDHVPSLNINTDRNAEDPGVAGGTTQAGGTPSPWVVWREEDGTGPTFQVFLSRAVAATAPGGACPTGTKPAGGNAVATFCWQQVGLPRLAKGGGSSATGDPSFSIDPTRNSVAPDVAFTGPSDTVAWVVWYEEDASTLPGITDTNDKVFAAKIVADGTADGGFRWQAVGNGTTGAAFPLDRSATNGFGPCAADDTALRTCTLNKNPTADAEDPRVAAGTLTAGGTTVPWVTWQEDIGGGRHGVFVSRLVGGDHFELFNGGSPLSNPLNDSTNPDITFAGHVPYLTWQEDVAGVHKLFAGHFEGTAFHLDTPNGVTASPGGLIADLRAPVSSTCTATPFSTDGDACRANALGTPFTLFNDGGKLFGDAYAPEAVSTGDPSGVTTSGATVAGAANPGGARTGTGFDFGPTAAYGSSVAAATLPAGTSVASFTAALTGLPANTTIHYRAVARSDFAAVTGPDRTLTTAQNPPPVVNKRPTSRITGLKAKVHRAKLKRFKGTASDPDGNLARVDVAVTRALGGARASAARKRCLVLGAKGRLVKGARKGGRCLPHFLKARGKAKWRFTLKKRLPRGRYVVYSRATDSRGLRQKGFSAKNRKALRVVR